MDLILASVAFLILVGGLWMLLTGVSGMNKK